MAFYRLHVKFSAHSLPHFHLFPPPHFFGVLRRGRRIPDIRLLAVSFARWSDPHCAPTSTSFAACISDLKNGCITLWKNVSLCICTLCVLCVFVHSLLLSLFAGDDSSSPHFDLFRAENYTVQVGGTAFLPCVIKNLRNESVSQRAKRPKRRPTRAPLPSGPIV